MSLLTAGDPEGIERQLLELLFNQHARQFSPFVSAKHLTTADELHYHTHRKIQEAIDKLPSLNESTLESLGLLGGCVSTMLRTTSCDTIIMKTPSVRYVMYLFVRLLRLRKWHWQQTTRVSHLKT